MELSSSEPLLQTTKPNKRRSRHHRTLSVEILSSVIPETRFTTMTSYPSEEWTKTWDFDDTSDEEVPLPSLLEAAMRRARAHSHVTTRLYALRAEGAQKKIAQSAPGYENINQPSFSASQLEFTDVGFKIADLGVICPISWRTTGWEGVLLDRTWLYDYNTATFDQEGVLIDPFLYMKKPKCIPLIYWRWLMGEEIKAAHRWAEGWAAEGPTTVWIKRWRNAELTGKEWSGRRGVGFVLEVDVLEF